MTNIQKKITLDPKYLSLSGRDKTKKTKTAKPKKIMSKPNHNPRTLRKKLIEKIKNYQQKYEVDELQPPVKETSFDDEFSTSLDFLQELSNKKKKKGMRKNNTNVSKTSQENSVDKIVSQVKNISKDATSNNITSSSNSTVISTSAPTESQHTESQHTESQHSPVITLSTKINDNQNRSTVKCKQPEYSCLKNGSRPTFREWKRMTQRNDTTHADPTNIKINIPSDNQMQQTPSQIERSSQLNKLKSDFKETNKLKSEIQNTTTPKKRCIAHKKIRTVKYKLGKTGKGVSVLVKNTNTRRRIKHEISLLQKKPISEVKQYLRDKNLLKVGSDAPNDVLRKMYEQAILSGELNNNNDDTLMHNFINDKK